MKVLFLPEVIDEFADAISYYESIYHELGLDFKTEVKTQIGKISEDPNIWPVREDATRRVSLSRFPYYIVYLLDKDIIRIIAVAHHKRFPEYWKGRI